MPKYYPKGWTAKQFEIYVLECAYRDRDAFLDSIMPTWGDPDEGTAQMIKDTKEEMGCIAERMRRIKNG